MKKLTLLGAIVLLAISTFSQNKTDPKTRDLEHKLVRYSDSCKRLSLSIDEHIKWGVIPISMVNDNLDYLDSCRTIVNQLRIIYFKNKDSINIPKVMDIQILIYQSRNYLKRVKDAYLQDRER